MPSLPDDAIPSRPTKHVGHQMRSRAEASFAQMLTDHGISWTYEPRTYSAPAGLYLPDFQLLDARAPENQSPCFIEVKPLNADFHATWNKMEIILATHPTATLYVAVITYPPVGAQLSVFAATASPYWSNVLQPLTEAHP